MAKLDFNIEGIDLNDRPKAGPIPAGEYVVRIDDTDVVMLKSGSGHRCAIEFVVAQGEFEGRRLFHSITLQHDSERVTEIGRRQFAEMLNAAGLAKIGDTSELHGRAVKAVVAIRNDEQYGERNDVKYVKHAESMTPPPVNNQQPTQGGAPWLK